MWPRRAIARAIRPTPPRPSSYRRWAARSSAASLRVLDFLVQSAALRAGLSVHSQCIAAAAAPRPSARARPAGGRADGGRRDRANARTDLGWTALWVGLAD